MKDLKITPPEGYEIDADNSTFEQIIFKELPKRGKTWEEISAKFRKHPKEDLIEITLDSTAFNIKKAKKLAALAKLFVIMDYYNDGWVPRIDGAEIVWMPNYNARTEDVEFGAIWITYSNPIIFKSEEQAREAYNNNKEIFDTFFKP